MFQLSVSYKNGLIAVIAMLGVAVFDTDSAVAASVERCEGFGDLERIDLTTWESGLGSWTVGRHDIAVPGDFTTPDWEVLGSLPDGRPGKAAFVENADDLVLCDLEEVDQTGALTLDSPEIVIPAGTQVPRISIDHWFAVEVDWDGGNFKISVNGGAFNLIPASAIEVDPYNLTLFPAILEGGTEWNTNPLAGEDAFSGPILSWWQSHVNLLGIAEAGDTVQLRIDFGLDECYGDIGWYVDNVEFYSCSAEGLPTDAQLTLVKTIINDNGGTITDPNAFGLKVDNVSVQHNVSNPFNVGNHKVSEDGLPGYKPGKWGGDCNPDGSITLVLDQNATCTITNDDIDPNEIIFKDGFE